VLPLLGAFAFSGLKLLPTMQMLFADLSLLRFNEPALQGLADDLSGPLPRPAAAVAAAEEKRPRAAPGGPERAEAFPTLAREIRLDDVHYRYPGAAAPALAGLSLTVAAGEMVGVAGPTGSGKTTTIDVILGLLPPERGRLLVDGVAVGARNRGAWQRQIGYVPQSIYLVDDTVAANIAFGIEPAEIDRDQVARAARMARIDEVVAALPRGYDTAIGEAGVRLSGGQRQRLGIARALYRDPGVIVFDEATSALDSLTEREVVEAVRALHGQKTILLIAHRLSTLVDCDRILVIEGGRLAGEGTYGELMERNRTFGSMIRAAG
jgi:ABC-type multidrug transport system fused ATPase/permease subunit